MTFTELSNMCWSLYFEPINEWGGSMGPNEGWQCNSISAQKKGASAVTSVCAFSHVSFGMRCFYFDVFVFTVLRDECVSYFRIWHVFCELPTMGSFTFLSLLPLRVAVTLMVLLCERK